MSNLITITVPDTDFGKAILEAIGRIAAVSLDFSTPTVQEQAEETPAPFFPSVGAPVEETPAPPPPVGELDSRGFPWDKRIHSSGQSKISDGSWKYLRGVPKDVIAKVEKELKPDTDTPPPPPPPSIEAVYGVDPSPPMSFVEFCQALQKAKRSTQDPDVRNAVLKYGIASPGLLAIAANNDKITLVARDLGLIDA